MKKTLLHPVWIKKNAVTPRNQKNVMNADDKRKRYNYRANAQGETLAEVKSRLKMWHLKNELCKLKA